MFLPLLGSRLALAGLLIPFGVFFPRPSFTALWRLRKRKVRHVWSWRRLARAQVLVPAAVTTAGYGWLFTVTPPGSPLRWLELALLAVSGVFIAAAGAVELRLVTGENEEKEQDGGADGESTGESTGLATGLYAVWRSVTAQIALTACTAVATGLYAWFVQVQLRGTIAKGTRSGPLGEAVVWLDAQLASAVFGPAYDRQWYWPLLVGGAGLLAVGCALLLINAHRRAVTADDPFRGAAETYGLAAESTSKVFVCYSRDDKEYARKLVGRLRERLGDIWIDWDAIIPSERWRESIAEGIRTSDAFLVLLSESSLASKYCWKECEQALHLRKRILPIVIDPELQRRSTSTRMRDMEWDELTAYQTLRLVEPDEDELAAGVEEIVAFVHQHRRWTAFHARLGVWAHQWAEGGRSDGLLLRRDELAVAELWRRRTPDEEEFRSGVTERQRSYLEASRRSVRRRTLRLRAALAAGTAAVVGLSGMAAVGQAGAEAQYRAALSRKLAGMPGEIADVDPEKALQYALAARGQADTAEARKAVAERLAAFNRVRTVVAPRQGLAVTKLALSRKGDVLLIARGHGVRASTQVWDVRRARSRGELPGSLLGSDSGAGALTADGRTMALRSPDGSRIDLVDTGTLRTERSVSGVDVPGPTDRFDSGAVSPDGERVLAMVFPGATNEFHSVLWDVRRHRLVQKLPDCISPEMAPSGRTAECFDGDFVDLAGPGGGKAGRDEKGEAGLPDLDRGKSHVEGFTADGGVLANVDGEARVYGPGDDSKPWTPAPDKAVTDATNGPSLLHGRYAVLAEAGKKPFELWDLVEREHLATAGTAEKALAARGGEGAPEFQQPDEGPEAESSEGKSVATAAADGSVVLWDKGDTGRVSRRLPVPADENAAYAVSADARSVASVSGRTLGIWDSRTGRHVRKIRLGEAGAGRLAFSRDGSLLAVTMGLGRTEPAEPGREPGIPLNVEVFRVRDGERVARFEAGTDTRNHIASVVFSPDGRTLYAALTGRFRVVAWKVADSGSRPRTVARSDGYADEAVLSDDGTMLAVTGRSGGVGVWRTASGTRVRTVPEAVNAAFSPDGKTLATTGGSGRSVSLWDLRTGRRTGSDLIPRSQAYRVRFSPDGRRLAVIGSPEGGLVERLQVTLWDLSSSRTVGPRLPEADADSAVGFSPDGERLVIAGPYGTSVVHTSAKAWVSSLCGMVTRKLSPAEWQRVAPGERYRWPC